VREGDSVVVDEVVARLVPPDTTRRYVRETDGSLAEVVRIVRESGSGMDKVVASAADAVADIASGSSLAVGGFGLCGLPSVLIEPYSPRASVISSR